MEHDDDDDQASRALEDLGLDFEGLLAALELEADLAALRAKRVALVDLIGTVPSAELRDVLLARLVATEARAVPNAGDRRTLLGEDAA